MSLKKLSQPIMTELKRYVADQNSILRPIVMSLSELIQLNSHHRENLIEVRRKQKKLSEVTAMIHAAHINHRCVRDIGCDTTTTVTAKRLHQENILTLLVGDYLLAQSSVDMADLRCPRAVGLIAIGLEDYTRGEFLKLQLLNDDLCEGPQLKRQIERYAELTCGSLLSNACLSAAILAGHPDKSTNLANKDDSTDLSNLIYAFGFHTGSAHGLIQFLHHPNIYSEADAVFMNTLDVGQFDDSITNHVDKSIELLLRLPLCSKGEKQSNDSRNRLLTMLNNMKSFRYEP